MRLRAPFHAALVWGLTGLLWSTARIAAQQEYVIVKPGAKEYHRPGCPLIRSARDVVAMTRAQAEGKRLKPHAGCDPSKTGERPQPPVFVYVAAGDTHYPRESCAKLGNPRQKVSLDAAGRKHWPCPVCKPPIRKRPA
jgi:hypothetical protein